MSNSDTTSSLDSYVEDSFKSLNINDSCTTLTFDHNNNTTKPSDRLSSRSRIGQIQDLKANDLRTLHSQKQDMLKKTEDILNIVHTPVQRTASEHSPLRKFLREKCAETKREITAAAIVPNTNSACCMSTYMHESLESRQNTYTNTLHSDKYQSYFAKKAASWSKYPNNLIDSHCHFEMLFSR